MNDLDLMRCIERTRRYERRPDMLHILDEMAKRLQARPIETLRPGGSVTVVKPPPCPVCEKARKRNVARQKRYREKEQRHEGDRPREQEAS